MASIVSRQLIDPVAKLLIGGNSAGDAPILPFAPKHEPITTGQGQHRQAVVFSSRQLSFKITARIGVHR
jgi:hypothetical protein